MSSGRKRANQPGYVQARDKIGRIIWVPDPSLKDNKEDKLPKLSDSLLDSNDLDHGYDTSEYDVVRIDDYFDDIEPVSVIESSELSGLVRVDDVQELIDDIRDELKGREDDFIDVWDVSDGVGLSDRLNNYISDNVDSLIVPEFIVDIGPIYWGDDGNNNVFGVKYGDLVDDRLRIILNDLPADYSFILQHDYTDDEIGELEGISDGEYQDLVRMGSMRDIPHGNSVLQNYLKSIKSDDGSYDFDKIEFLSDFLDEDDVDRLRNSLIETVENEHYDTLSKVNDGRVTCLADIKSLTISDAVQSLKHSIIEELRDRVTESHGFDVLGLITSNKKKMAFV